MKVLIISDGHGALEMLDKLAPIAKDMDLVLFGGDFAEFQKPETGLPFLEKLTALNENVFSVSGNCDEIDFRDTLEKFDVGIEGTLSYFSGLVLTGSGGGSYFTGVTPNERTDEELVGDLHMVEESIPEDMGGDIGAWNNLIVISHNPPKDTAVDAVGKDGHAGSPLLRTFIETYKPLLVVSGHIHEAKAIDRLEETTLVNPGPLSHGNYALAEITGGKTKPFTVSAIQLCTL